MSDYKHSKPRCLYILTGIAICIFQLLFVFLGRAQDAGVDSSFHIYLLMGQSNMSGRGYLNEKWKAEHNDRVLVLTKGAKWVVAHNPLHYDKPKVVGVGPGLSFGIKMATYDKNVRIGLVPCAVGGTPIEHWRPGAYDKATHTHPYDDALERIRTAMKAGIICGVIWHQGEADSDPEKSKTYVHHLAALIRRIRMVTHDADLPFVAGELGRFYKRQQNLNPKLAAIKDSVAFTEVASSKGLTDRGDHLHFNSESAETLGSRYAIRMHALEKRIGKLHERRSH